MSLKKIILLSVILILTGCSLILKKDTNYMEDYYKDGLPILYIHPKPTSHDFYTPLVLIYKGREYKAEGKIRGAASAYFPKKSYTIKFEDDDLFFTDEGSEKKKIVLNSNFDDNSYIRNRLAFYIWDKLDNNFSISTSSKVIYMNGRYHGLYTMIDYIGEDFIMENSTEEALKDVQSQHDYSLYKNKLKDADFSSVNNPVGYEKKLGYPEPGSPGDMNDIKEFISIIQSSENFNEKFEQFADSKSYFDWWFFTSLIKAEDSAGRNSYHFHNLVTDKWYYIPWDFNASFGQNVKTGRIVPSAGDGLIYRNDIFKKIVNNSFFTEKYIPDYLILLDTDLSLDSILAEVDRLFNEIRLAGKKDEKVWRDIYKKHFNLNDRKDSTTMEEEILYIKNWIKEQHALWYEQFKEF
ncbi:MAG: hypothetical protein B6229_08510 [Spirochaetaceae bacterium 4572_7]|nr:MAG: hypothetical protein B6229_08510 [Spirochaetaceae bacterium 4572_7]